MAHSKRNTSLAFFTSYERSLLKNEYGTLKTRLMRESFKSIDSCNLCLRSARDPIACEHGDVFCRECAVENLLAQRREMDRLERESGRRVKEEEEERRREEEEARKRVVREFEMTQMGLEKKGGLGSGEKEGTTNSEDAQARKRKFELDEKEVDRITREETERAIKAIKTDAAASSKTALPFWHPSQTPSTAPSAPKALKLQPSCPASHPDKPHAFSLKDLIPLQFTDSTDEKTSQGTPARICPACNKVLSNARKACFCAPCGHVLCKPCVDDFMLKERDDPHGKKRRLRCYVCDESVEMREKDKAEGKKKKKFRGVVTITSDGTGFASAGGSTVEKNTTAFLV